MELGRRCLFLLFLLLLTPSCGDDEEGTAPVLTGIQYTSSRYQVGFGDGKAPLTGSVEFKDPDGDVVLLRVAWRDCGEDPPKVLEVLHGELIGETTGSIPFTILLTTSCPPGNYLVEVSVRDGQGHGSEPLMAPYEIYE